MPQPRRGTLSPPFFLPPPPYSLNLPPSPHTPHIISPRYALSRSCKDWSCCGRGMLEPCRADLARAFTPRNHRGSWRALGGAGRVPGFVVSRGGTSRAKNECCELSPTASADMRCLHGPRIVRAPHWTCCGREDYFADCGPAQAQEEEEEEEETLLRMLGGGLPPGLFPPGFNPGGGGGSGSGSGGGGSGGPPCPQQ